MADNKVLKTRIQMKNDTSENWAKATTFVPLKGELIVYNDNDGNAPRMKVGDGVTLLSGLPFITSSGGSFLFQPEEPEDAEEGTIWIDTDEESNTINYVSYDEQYRTEEQKANARNNIGAAYNNITTVMSIQEYENLSDADFAELYANGVRTLHVENDGTFVDKAGIHYIDATLLATDWNDQKKQTIVSSFIKANSSGELTMTKTISDDQVFAAASAMILITAQNEGSIEVTAFGEVPEFDIPVVIRVVN